MEYNAPVQVKPVAPPPQSGIGPGGWFAAFFAIMLLVSVGFNLFLIAAGMKLEAPQLTPRKQFREIVVDGEAGAKNKILIIDAYGVISDEGQASPFGVPMPSMVQEITMQLREAQHDPDVVAIILNVNSPGGGVDASETIYNEILRTQKSGGVDGKKLFVQMNGVAASGGYYISASADRILAHPTTITGSIGVIAQFPVYAKAMEYLNIEMVTIKSGAKKDWGSPFDEFTADERDYIQGIVDHAYERFVTLVGEGRKMDKDAARALATGEVYTADAALANGLIDEIGFLDDTIKLARKEVGDSGAAVIRYAPAATFLQQMLNGETAPVVVNTGVQVNLSDMAARTPRFSYLWHVGN